MKMKKMKRSNIHLLQLRKKSVTKHISYFAYHFLFHIAFHIAFYIAFYLSCEKSFKMTSYKVYIFVTHFYFLSLISRFPIFRDI